MGNWQKIKSHIDQVFDVVGKIASITIAIPCVIIIAGSTVLGVIGVVVYCWNAVVNPKPQPPKTPLQICIEEVSETASYMPKLLIKEDLKNCLDENKPLSDPHR